nr:MAG TPA: STE like transcription factor [Inoviridae sp.]
MTVYIWQIAIAVNTQKKQFVKLYFWSNEHFLV